MERREFIAILASTPAMSIAGAHDQSAASAAKPLSVTLIGTGTPSPSLDRQSSGYADRNRPRPTELRTMPRFPLIALWLIAVSITLRAQPPADFSGKWTLDAPAIASTAAVPGTPSAAAAPGDMGSGWGSTITISQDARRLSIEYPIFSRYDLQPPLTLTYPLDGSVGRNTLMMGRGEQIQSSRAQWNEQTLIIITTFDVAERGAGKPFTAELTRKVWLESPTTLVVEVTRAGVLGGPASTTRSVYRKN